MEERDYDLPCTPVDTLVHNLDEHSPDEIKHWGIKGMRWGVRRYQNKDGSLTNAGKKRRAKLESELKELSPKKKQKTPSEMTNKELEKYIARRNAERIAYGLDRDISTLRRQSSDDGQNNSNQNQNQQGNQQGNQQKKSVFKDQVLTPVAVDIGKKAMSKLGDTLLSKIFGENAPDGMAAIKKEVEKVELDKRLAEAKNALAKATQKQERSWDDRIKELDYYEKLSKKEAREAARDIASGIKETVKNSSERGQAAFHRTGMKSLLDQDAYDLDYKPSSGISSKVDRFIKNISGDVDDERGND